LSSRRVRQLYRAALAPLCEQDITLLTRVQILVHVLPQEPLALTVLVDEGQQERRRRAALVLRNVGPTCEKEPHTGRVALPARALKSGRAIIRSCGASFCFLQQPAQSVGITGAAYMHHKQVHSLRAAT